MVKKTARQIYEEDPPISLDDNMDRWNHRMILYLNMLAEETTGMTPGELYEYYRKRNERFDNQNKQDE